MATWYKEGVYGELTEETAEGKRKTAKLYSAKGEDLFITSIREGTHGVGSFHPSGRAWDQRAGGVPISDHRLVLGKDFDIVDEKDHRHVEYDPK